MNNNPPKKVFHLAITMAGAVSAGAYTAGVIDYLLENLDKWYELKKEAQEFFKKYESLQIQGKTWDELDQLQLEKSLLRQAKLYNAVPTHDVQIEILSGASAGGMTAAISSFVLHQKRKFPVKRKLKNKTAEEIEKNEEAKKRNRLYHSWVNLTGQSDMLPEMLSNYDITGNPTLNFPLSLFNSRFIRDVSDQALQINNTKNISLSPYVAKDFNLFVTLTNLKGFAKSVSVNRVEQRYQTDFITYDHRDLMMFDFCDKPTPGIINVNFNQNKKDENYETNSRLLVQAAISTGAFPIGLEYGFIKRDAQYINLNPLLNPQYETSRIIETLDYHSVFVDGGLINNEPFDLTKKLLYWRITNQAKGQILNGLMAKIKEVNPDLSEAEVIEALDPEEIKERIENYLIEEKYNRTILMIDPFPSEKMTEQNGHPEGFNSQYPYSFLGAILQLLGTMRTQLLVKADLLESGFNSDFFDCFLIAPRRRVYQTDENGTPILKNGIYQSVYETNSDGEIIRGDDGDPIPKAYDGSAAIACGSLAGFGGFLSREFREHDFFLGKINCKSFLRHHFRIETDPAKASIVKEGYQGEAADIFRITQKKEIEKEKFKHEYFYPIIPDVGIIEKILDKKADRNYFKARKDIDILYGELDYPEYSVKNFQKHRRALRKRLWKVVISILKLFLTPVLLTLLKPVVWIQFWAIYEFIGFKGISKQIKKQLGDWQLLKRDKPALQRWFRLGRKG